uniref:4Fe-4S binding protein n=1 Tax=uncultured Aeromicrobium sp. TaxID=337820 RepID=UPI0025E8715E
MAYAITQSCCNDASCVSVCPVDCIHPTPDEPDFGTTDILYVDPRSCIDCGACADACPVSAVKPVDLLRGGEEVFAQLNADFYGDRPERRSPATHTWEDMGPTIGRPLRIAVVGTGPAASYAARHLLLSTDASVTMFDKSPVPGGLVRGGVAPDHGATKGFTSLFSWTYRHPRTSMFMNVEVGEHISHAELLQFHDAVIYGVGARLDRELGVPGEDLDGVYGAPQVVAWYNGALEVAADAVRLEGERLI